MRRFAALLPLLVLLACAARREDPKGPTDPIVVPPQPPPLTTASASSAPPPPTPPLEPVADGTGVALAPAVKPQSTLFSMNGAALRAHPLGLRIDGIVAALPQWRSAFPDHRPARDLDWVVLYGPSLVHTDRSVLVARTRLSDDVVARALETESKRYDKGRPHDTGVPGVKAWLAHWDNGERVMMIPHPKTVAFAPPPIARDVAVFYHRAEVGSPPREELFRVRLEKPKKTIQVPNLDIPESVKEARIVVLAAPGARVQIDFDCADETTAKLFAEALNVRIKSMNTGLVKLMTARTLDLLVFEAQGTMAKAAFEMSSHQLEAIVSLLEAAMGVRPT